MTYLPGKWSIQPGYDGCFCYCRELYHALVLNSSCVISIMKNPLAKRGFLGGSRRTSLRFGFGLVFISSSPELREGAETGARVIGAVPIAFEMESKGRSGRETGKEGLRRGGRAVEIVIGAARTWADWVFEIVGTRACLVGKGVNTDDGGGDS